MKGDKMKKSLAEKIASTCIAEQPEENVIDHPSHYTQGGIECIEAIKASMSRQEFLGYLKGNAMKYLWRYQNKGKPAEDLKKHLWYSNRLLKELEEYYT